MNNPQSHLCERQLSENGISSPSALPTTSHARFHHPHRHNNCNHHFHHHHHQPNIHHHIHHHNIQVLGSRPAPLTQVWLGSRPLPALHTKVSSNNHHHGHHHLLHHHHRRHYHHDHHDDDCQASIDGNVSTTTVELRPEKSDHGKFLSCQVVPRMMMMVMMITRRMVMVMMVEKSMRQNHHNTLFSSGKK